MFLRDFIAQECANAIASAFPQLQLSNPPEVTVATKREFGHYQCNEAMKLARPLRLPPREIATQIQAHLTHNAFDRIEIAGPGFINIILRTSFLESQLLKLPEQLQPGYHTTTPQRIVIDFSSPNIAKEMHVGHLRSTIIGDSLARIFTYMGHDVLRLNHIGDWGTSFGMLIAHIQELDADYRLSSLDQLTQLYKDAHARFKEDEQFRTQARKKVVELQQHQPDVHRIWQDICSISEQAFSQIYTYLDISITTRGESFYNPYLPQVIEDLRDHHLLQVSDGAQCIFLEDFDIPLIVQKNDGGYNYATTDLAAIRYRVQQDHADQIIIITDAGQSLHFSMVKAAALNMHYLPHPDMYHHVGFGVVLDAQGKKFKTRSGSNIKLIDLLQTAIDHARSLLQERHPEFTDEQLQHYARILGINAIKYADLSTHRMSDYIFSFEKMLRFEGNTALFILYSYVRIQGIKRRLQVDQLPLPTPGAIQITCGAEEDLAVALLQFHDTLALVMRDYTPHVLAEYLYHLASSFNAFFRDCHIENSEYQHSRLILCGLAERVLHLGCQLLGLKTLPVL